MKIKKQDLGISAVIFAFMLLQLKYFKNVDQLKDPSLKLAISTTIFLCAISIVRILVGEKKYLIKNVAGLVAGGAALVSAIFRRDISVFKAALLIAISLYAGGVSSYNIFKKSS